MKHAVLIVHSLLELISTPLQSMDDDEKWAKFYCSFPHKTPDSKPSAGINMQTAHYHCFKCKRTYATLDGWLMELWFHKLTRKEDRKGVNAARKYLEDTIEKQEFNQLMESIFPPS